MRTTSNAGCLWGEPPNNKVSDASDAFAAPLGSAADPRVGKLTPEDAAMLKKLAEDMGALDCMPAWMRDEIEAKTQPPNVKGSGGE